MSKFICMGQHANDTSGHFIESSIAPAKHHTEVFRDFVNFIVTLSTSSARKKVQPPTMRLPLSAGAVERGARTPAPRPLLAGAVAGDARTPVHLAPSRQGLGAARHLTWLCCGACHAWGALLCLPLGLKLLQRHVGGVIVIIIETSPPSARAPAPAPRVLQSSGLQVGDRNN